MKWRVEVTYTSVVVVEAASREKAFLKVEEMEGDQIKRATFNARRRINRDGIIEHVERG